MKPTRLFLVAMLCWVLPLGARVVPGDSVSKMRLELGEPTGQIVRGATITYSYPQGGVQVRDGRVVRLSEGFYEAVDQIVRQSSEGQVQRNLSDESAALGIAEAGTDAAALQWHTDWTEASQLSQESQRPLLIIFTNSDDCPHCREWERLLHDATFIDYARDGLVLLWVEDPAIGERSESLAEPSRLPWASDPVESTPALRLLAPDQTELGRLSYEPLIPDALVAHLDAMRALKAEAEAEPVDALTQGDLGETLDQLLLMNGISGSAILLSAQLFAGSVLSFLLIRRWMRK